MTVHIKRHIAKTITYRLLGTLVTCVISFLFIGDIKISAMLGIAELVVKPITYFIHERVWYKWITFGLTNKKKE